MKTPDQRWEAELPHNPRSHQVKNLIERIQDIEDYGIKFGGDGDLGETILYILDEYFEQTDINHEP